MKKRSAARLVPLILLLLSAVVVLPRRNTLTAEAILHFSPSSPPLAAIFLLALFAGKGLSFFFPLAVLETAGGLLFPLRIALPINLLGAALSMTAPFYLGRRDRDGLAAFLKRHPRLQTLEQARGGGNFFFVWLIRLVGGFPFDLVSFYFGAAGLPYGQYLAAGLLGLLPHTAAATFLGTALSDPQPQRIITAVGLNAAVSVAALTLWRIRQKKRTA